MPHPALEDSREGVGAMLSSAIRLSSQDEPNDFGFLLEGSHVGCMESPKQRSRESRPQEIHVASICEEGTRGVPVSIAACLEPPDGPKDFGFLLAGVNNTGPNLGWVPNAAAPEF